jgi:hypothetical protein
MARAKRIYKSGKKGSEYDAYHKKPIQRKRRYARVAARREAERKGLVSKGDGREVHHVRARRTGLLDNTKVRVVDRATNRRIQPKRS